MKCELESKKDIARTRLRALFPDGRFKEYSAHKRKLINKPTMEEAAFIAVATGNTVRLQNLLKQGLDPNAITYRWKFARTASLLHIAIDYKQFDAAHILLDAGADPIAQRRVGETPYETLLNSTKRPRPASAQSLVTRLERPHFKWWLDDVEQRTGYRPWNPDIERLLAEG